MKHRSSRRMIFLTVLCVAAILNSGCDVLESIVRGLARVCAMPEYVVTRGDDPPGGLCTETSCSLRQAVALANSCPGEPHTIRIPGGTYILTRTGTYEDANRTGDLDILKSVNLIGEGMPALDGNHIDRVFDIKPDASVSMQNLIIQGGLAQWGGGITSAGQLTASNVLFQDNQDTIGGAGAAMWSSGSASISHSAFYNNISYEETAGVGNSGTLLLDNVTITGNHGYGIENRAPGTAQVTYSTIADNPGAYEIWNSSTVDSFKISNSIVSGHVDDGNCFQPINSEGFNIDSSTASSGNICGLNKPTDLNGVDPQLQPVAPLGGLPIRPLADGSPALDSADPARCGGTDQRGVARPQGPACDRGAYEKTLTQANPTAPPLSAATPVAPKIVASDTPSPVAQLCQNPTLVLTQNAFCRTGPGTGYPDVTGFVKGTEVQIDGRNDSDPLWWWVRVPNTNGHCWISFIGGSASCPADQIPETATPPPPPEPEALDCTSIASDATCNATDGCTYDYVGKKCLAK